MSRNQNVLALAGALLFAGAGAAHADFIFTNPAPVSETNTTLFKLDIPGGTPIVTGLLSISAGSFTATNGAGSFEIIAVFSDASEEEVFFHSTAANDVVELDTVPSKTFIDKGKVTALIFDTANDPAGDLEIPEGAKFTFSTPVPEPASLTLLAAGLALLAGGRQRRKRRGAAIA